jgi:hypothetical protein
MTGERLRSRARLLGFAGLIPFLVAAAVLVAGPASLEALALRSLLAYGAIILSFMGAVHWGLAMTSSRDDAIAQLSLSVLPALLGWVALLLPAVPACLFLLAGFAGLYWFDLRAAPRGAVPDWYPALRLPLTTGVVLCLAVALWRLV